MKIRYRFTQILNGHFIALGTILLGGWWTWTMVIMFLIGPILEYFDKVNKWNPPEDQVKEIAGDRFYRYVTFAFVPVQLGLVAFGCWAVSRPGLGLHEIIGIILSIGFTSGVSIIVSHELVHRREKFERALGGLMLASVSYATFKVEHTRGHHVNVSTPEDASSAPYGQSFYRFLPGAIVRNPVNGFKLEAKRLRRRGHSPWSWRNELAWWTLLSVAFCVLAGYFLGWMASFFFIAQSLVGISLLELVNYVEHYGLERRKLPTGRYKKVTPLHSWNSSEIVSNVMTLNLQRHSDHHANPMRRYQVLRHFEESPQLPKGYATMIIVALVPPLWFKIMNPRARQAMDNIRQGFQISVDDDVDVNLQMDPELLNQANPG